VWDSAATAAAAMEKNSISISGSNMWMATVRLAADKATLDVSWTNYFTECKSNGKAYFKSKNQTGGKRVARPGHKGRRQLPPPPGAAHATCRQAYNSQRNPRNAVFIHVAPCKSGFVGCTDKRYLWAFSRDIMDPA